MPEPSGGPTAAVPHSSPLVVLSGIAPATPAAPAEAHRGPTRWDCLAHYESSHRWHINTGNGHYGGLQFSLSTWRYFGGPRYSGEGYPHRATRTAQIVIARRTGLDRESVVLGKRVDLGGRRIIKNKKSREWQ